MWMFYVGKKPLYGNDRHAMVLFEFEHYTKHNTSNDRSQSTAEVNKWEGDTNSTSWLTININKHHNTKKKKSEDRQTRSECHSIYKLFCRIIITVIYYYYYCCCCCCVKLTCPVLQNEPCWQSQDCTRCTRHQNKLKLVPGTQLQLSTSRPSYQCPAWCFKFKYDVL